MLAGVIVATVAIHIIIGDPLWAGIALGLCNGAEALITAGLIQYFFGAGFRPVRLRQVIGFLVAAIVGTSVSGIGGAVTYRVLRGPSAPMLETWQHWFASDAIGIIAVAPLMIGLTAIVRRPSPRSEVRVRSPTAKSRRWSSANRPSGIPQILVYRSNLCY